MRGKVELFMAYYGNWGSHTFCSLFYLIPLRLFDSLFFSMKSRWGSSKATARVPSGKDSVKGEIY